MTLHFTNRNRYLWASASDYGDDAVEDDVLTDADADRVWQDVRNIDITPTGEIVHVQRQRGTAAGNAHAFAKGACEVSGEVPLLPFISATDQIPYNDTILKMMGFEPDLSEPDEATYRLRTPAQPDATIYKYVRNVENANWRLMVARGCRANGNFNFEINTEPFIGIADGVAHYSQLTQSAAFIDSDGAAALLKDGSTAVTALSGGDEFFADQSPLLCQAMSFTIGGVTHIVSALNLDLGWTVDALEAVNGDETLHKAVLTRDDTDSRPNGSFSLADMTEDQLDDILAMYESGEEAEVKIVASNGSGRVTFTMPKVQIGILEESSVGNVRTYDIPYFCNGDFSDLAGDNDVEILFDAE